jgi:D-aminoacyl-tRNA deacylase
VRALVQRVLSASVTVEEEIVGQIGPGLLLLVGIHRNDQEAQIPRLAEKIVQLRLFADPEGKMNRSLKEIGGEILVVSQFTLYGTCDKGRRPEFTQAARGNRALHLYEAFVTALRRDGQSVATGAFGAYMQVASINDGPVTLLLEA